VKTKRSEGFTLIELMVALVVAGLLVSVLVGLSATVQQSYGRSKDIIELQANLRFAMKILTDDLTRAAYMFSPDAANDNCHRYGSPPDTGWSATPTWKAIEYDAASYTLTLRGNYLSSTDYLMRLDGINSGTILCRDQTILALNDANPAAASCGSGTYASTGLTTSESNIPFRTSEEFKKVFASGQLFRLDAEDRHYTYHYVSSTGTSLKVNFSPDLNRDKVRGHFKWVNPVATVRYQIAEKTAGSGNWVLSRIVVEASSDTTKVEHPVEIAEFLLPPNDANAPGFSIQVYNDSGGGICQVPWQPSISAPVALDGSVDPTKVRAMVVTLRGRTPVEDPDFTLDKTDSGSGNFGYDVDTAQAGMAYVRTESTIIEMRNLGLNLSL
jgi:prepilin-type N-terminal cleavage/methylation domain-containing protein